MQNFTKFNLIHAIKITVASLTAVITANLLQLDYAGSCAVIALITVAATRKETFLLSFKRLLTFFITILLSFLLYQLIGINYATFGLLMFLLAVISYGLDMYGTISVNAVIATHILSETVLTVPFLLNETLLVLIGTGIAILLNLYMPGETKEIKEAIIEIEQMEKHILRHFKSCLSDSGSIDMLPQLIEALKQYIKKSTERAQRNQENILAEHSAYYRLYMDMRKEQCRLLEQMEVSLRSITDYPSQADTLGQFFGHVADAFHEYNSAEALLVELKTVEHDLQYEQLPQTRSEFESRAVLYHMLLQLHSFLELKRDFVSELSPKQVDIYWNK